MLLSFVEHVLAKEADIVARNCGRARVVQRRVESLGEPARVPGAEDVRFLALFHTCGHVVERREVEHVGDLLSKLVGLFG